MNKSKLVYIKTLTERTASSLLRFSLTIVKSFGFTSEFHWVESRILRRTFPTCFDFDNASYQKIFTDFSKCRYIISGTYIQKKCGSQRRKNQERSSRGISSIDDKFSGLFLNPNVSRC